MRPCTRRIVPAEDVIKATSLHDVLGEHAPWCRTAPNAPLIHTKPQGADQLPIGLPCVYLGRRNETRFQRAIAQPSL